MLRRVYRSLRASADYHRLPARARREDWSDQDRGLREDPGLLSAVDAAVAWLCTAQDRSRSRDGGVARDFSLVTGWSTSYPETTGYIVPTMLARAAATGNDSLRRRGERMLDWLVSIQFSEGGFQGGRIDQTPRVPVTFNTGQILLGLVAGVRHLGRPYLQPMLRAADWLVATQDGDGCWRNHQTPFAAPGEKTYEMHAAWALMEADRVAPGAGYGEAALRQVDWALQRQHANGWFASNCLTDSTQPLTHTIGYALRGVIEAYRFSRDERYLEAACRCANALLRVVGPDGHIPGRLASDWSGTVPWVCLTGSAQIAHCWLLLFRETGEPHYLGAAQMANRYVRRTMHVDGPIDTRGAVKGSFPISGDYGRFEYLSWACKFMIDANLLEHALVKAASADVARDDAAPWMPSRRVTHAPDRVPDRAPEIRPLEPHGIEAADALR